MKMKANNKSIAYALAKIFIMLLFLAMPAQLFAQEMQNYCITPPYVKVNVAPNIMILMDNSTDMYNHAYSDAYTPNATKDNYIGYYLPQSCYSYDNGHSKFAELPKTGSTAGNTPNSYTSYTYADQCPSTAPFRGNFLNWATMSKYDVLQKVLLGGNSVSKQTNANTLLSISGSWTKTYNSCVLNVNNANLTITENTPGACQIIDTIEGTSTSPDPWLQTVYLNQQRFHAFYEKAVGWVADANSYASIGIKGFGKFASKALDMLNPVSEAWAATTGIGILTGSLNGTIGSTYSITFQCTGGSSACPSNATYNWTISNKPAWLTTTTYTSSGQMINYQVTLSGIPTPSTATDYGNITIAFTASSKSASRQISISVTPASLSITTSSPLVEGNVGLSYGPVTISGQGGVTHDAVPTIPYTWTYQWSATGLPPGLSIDPSTGVISGTPTTAAVYNAVVTMTDGDTGTPSSVNKTFSITIIASSLVITTPNLPDGTVSSAYSATLAGAGGSSAGYAWAITSGYLPFGFTLDSTTGVISGKTCPFTSTGALPDVIGNGAGSGPGIATGVNYLKTDTFSVLSGHSYEVTACPAKGGSFTGDPWLQLTGVYNYYNDDSSCGLGPDVTFTAGASGTETLDQSTWGPSHTTADTSWSYNITDTTDNRQCAGTFPFTVSLTDSIGTSVHKDLSIIIGAGALQIATTGLASAAKGVPYSFSMIASGGTAPYTWSATGLPSGFSIDPASGVITGLATATQVGTPVTITLTDSIATTVSKTYMFTVAKSLILRSHAYNVKVDIVEEPMVDVNGNDFYDPGYIGESFVDLNGNGKWDGKHGVFQQYWDNITLRARWGLTKFSHQGVDISACIPASPAASFYTTMQNATPSDSAPLASGLFGDINYYGFNSPFGMGYAGCNNSDPIDDVVCRKNYVLIVSSGADLTGTAFTTNPDSSAFSSAICTVTAGREANRDNPLVKNACYGYMNDLRSDKPAKQQVTTFAINTMGTAANGQILQDAALAGGGKYYDASIATNLEAQLNLAFQDMLARAAAGTAASVLASGEGSGANLIQAVFYPRRKFGDTEISWIGRLSNLWYYVDPRFSTSSIREDDGSKLLDLKTAPSGTRQDYIVSLHFNGEATMATRWTDTNGDGVVDSLLSPDIQFEYLGTLWEAGKLLWDRTASSRTLYTSLTGSLVNFSTANRTALKPYLQAASDSEAEAIIRWVQGEDTPFSPAISPAFTPSYRGRSVQISTCSNNTNRVCSVDADCGAGNTCVLTGPNTWKLGDVLNSTPKISTWQALNGYHTIQKDSTYGVPGSDPYYGDPADSTHYITSSAYKNRGMIFAGANDGMLHAIKLGTLELKWSGQSPTEKAKLSGTNLGQEIWAYIPKNALPYLTYDTDSGYCHVYTVDLTPYVFDASIGRPATCTETNTADCIKSASTWRTIVIGGMRYGGACRKKGAACNSGSDCVNTPIVDPADGSKGLGYSSYFALDITDQNSPQLLWEFSDPALGFSTSGPTVVRINAKNLDGTSDTNKNGHWFVVFGSGPTGPIDTSAQQFLGRSDQPLKIFVLNLPDGSLAATIPTGIPTAFAGSVYNATLDPDLNYQDDVMYVPYVKKCAATTSVCTVDTWTDGGVGRITTKEDVNPANWVWSKVIDGVGPLTSSVVKLQNNAAHTLWLFFGTGRYFFELTGGDADDGSGQRAVFGVKDPCFTSAGYVKTCTTSVSPNSLTNVTNVADVVANPAAGWFINLDPDPSPASTFRAEREITDPLAASTGVVFFTTYKPYTDQCALGGNSFIWAVKYDTGGSAETLLKGKALIQVSTGSIEQLDLSSAFTNAGNRKTGGMEGVPPTAQGLSIMTTPPPIKRVLHKRER